MAIDVNLIANTVAQEKKEKQDRLDNFDKAISKYFENEKATEKVVLGVETEKLSNTLKDIDHTSNDADFTEGANSIDMWLDSALAISNNKNEETQYIAQAESYTNLLTSKQDNQIEYNQELVALNKTKADLEKLQNEANFETYTDEKFTDIEEVMSSYESILEGMYTYIDKTGPIATGHKNNIKDISDWINQGKILKGYDIDSETEGIQTGQDLGATFDTYMEMALNSWTAGDATGSNNNLELARQSISAEERLRRKFNEEMKEASRNQLLGTTAGQGSARGGGYIQREDFTEDKLQLIKTESSKKQRADAEIGVEYIPSTILNQNDMALIELIASGDPEAIKALNTEQENFYDKKLDNQEGSIQTAFTKLDTYFGGGVGPNPIKNIDPGLKEGAYELVNIRPASSADGYYESPEVRNQLKGQLSDNILKIFKNLDSGVGGYFGGDSEYITSTNMSLLDPRTWTSGVLYDNYYDPNNHIQALIDGELYDKETKTHIPIVTGDSNYKLLMSKIAETYTGDMKTEAKELTVSNFGGNETQSYNMLIAHLEAYKALDSMEYLMGNQDKVSGNFDIKKRN